MAINSPKLEFDKQTLVRFDGVDFESITYFKSGEIPRIEKGGASLGLTFRAWLEQHSKKMRNSKQYESNFKIGQEHYKVSFQATENGYKATMNINNKIQICN